MGLFSFSVLLTLVALQEEQEAIIKSKEKSGEEKVLSWADTKKMPITSRVIQETLRVASILSFTFREAVEDVEYEGQFQLSRISDKNLITYPCLCLSQYADDFRPFYLFISPGYLIPKGWKVLPLFRNIHHSPEIFPDPEKFDPSRFKVTKIYI